MGRYQITEEKLKGSRYLGDYEDAKVLPTPDAERDRVLVCQPRTSGAGAYIPRDIKKFAPLPGR
ncbi:hypothetical protein [Calderihabitans maritimus]|uniref:Uncharacterized protein n=1 Tax=Calderihabitans maritimus TaxID=1246530 RepID=A0A1Z5HUU3_9FIRM|nr:hypothetical protein [Calderihabitans maritimus]GAW93303.1 hypothetical protein KKC1_24400 [Calderihabitans maritimus]